MAAAAMSREDESRLFRVRKTVNLMLSNRCVGCWHAGTVNLCAAGWCRLVYRQLVACVPALEPVNLTHARATQSQRVQCGQ